MQTYIGQIKTPQDALIIFEACRQGSLKRVHERLSSKERNEIRSGDVFVWDEYEASMRRWTDGRTWSPSRVSGSFLTYRELSTKRRPRRHNLMTPVYMYKPNGLIKQSFSICTATNQKLHLISYITKDDVNAGNLPLPSADPNLRKIVVPAGLYPELNPSLDTNASGNSSPARTALRHSSSITDHQATPSLSSSPSASSDDDDQTMLSPINYHSPPSPSMTSTSNNNNNNSIPSLSTLCDLPKPKDSFFCSIPTVSSEDKRQLQALHCQLRL
ncbi:hypothetical protein K492DRAFT_178274 [Lichtheimia hyalospora FSU 10163]|nr:hypothetical protein K492DRAFT_178274 [Lichtheimia hyalospora FSU 10163]